jgi:hypothetical protein
MQKPNSTSTGRAGATSKRGLPLAAAGEQAPGRSNSGSGELGCAPHTDIDLSPRDAELNASVSVYQAQLQNWTCWGISLSDLTARFHQWAPELWAQFVPSEWAGRPIARPEFVFVFERQASHILGHYLPGRNAAGLRFQISVNPVNLPQLPEIKVAAILLHELFHAFEDLAATAPQSHNGYHSSWLRKTTDAVGIPCTAFGCMCGVRPESPFMNWALRRELSGTPMLVAEPGEQRRAKEKRRPWICDCPAEEAITIYAPSAARLRARCELCNARFHSK